MSCSVYRHVPRFRSTAARPARGLRRGRVFSLLFFACSKPLVPIPRAGALFSLDAYPVYDPGRPVFARWGTSTREGPFSPDGAQAQGKARFRPMGHKHKGRPVFARWGTSTREGIHDFGE